MYRYALMPHCPWPYLQESGISPLTNFKVRHPYKNDIILYTLYTFYHILLLTSDIRKFEENKCNLDNMSFRRRKGVYSF